MIVINSHQDLAEINNPSNQLPESAEIFLSKFFDQLHQLLVQGKKPFRLSDHGYRLLLLVKSDTLVSLRTAGFRMYDHFLEYVECLALDDCLLFKACITEDNENFTFVISVTGIQSKEVENWFSHHMEGGVLHEEKNSQL
ncbi:hypothetical protein SAMN03159341_12257 [Paenibacillus sp. 1_12]|nr:hypothetical protein SAMN03159341_12257 [Paenibacillus sp. 1_12]